MCWKKYLLWFAEDDEDDCERCCDGGVGYKQPARCAHNEKLTEEARAVRAVAHSKHWGLAYQCYIGTPAEMCKKKIILVSACRPSLTQKCFPRAMTFYGKRIYIRQHNVSQLTCTIPPPLISFYIWLLVSRQSHLSDSVSGHDPWSRTASLLTATSQVVTYQ